MARESGLSQTAVSRFWLAFGLLPDRRGNLQAVDRSAVRCRQPRPAGTENGRHEPVAQRLRPRRVLLVLVSATSKLTPGAIIG
jgi:hypothetical protein